MNLKLERAIGGKYSGSFLLAIALGLAGVMNAAADPTLAYISVSAQSPSSIQPGQSATYTVTANRTGNGSMDVYCSVAGLPTGAVASFSPGWVIKFPDGGPSAKSAVMTISTTPATPPGVYPLTITGRHGNGSKIVTCTGTLVISAATVTDQPQLIVAIDPQAEGSKRLTCSGRGGRTYTIQATLSLGEPSWIDLGTATADSNGWFNYLDEGAIGCDCRFYRTVAK